MPPAAGLTSSSARIAKIFTTGRRSRRWATCWQAPRNSTEHKNSTQSSPEHRGLITRCELRLRWAALCRQQDKHADAIQQYDSVLAMSEDSDSAKAQKLSATLGKAISLAATSHVDDATKMIEDVIQNADPEQKELQARAYNALGTSYEKAGKTKDGAAGLFARGCAL